MSIMLVQCVISVTLELIETPFNTFAKSADPNQAALIGSTLFASD